MSRGISIYNLAFFRNRLGVLFTLAAWLLSGCGQSAYFIAPHSSPTLLPEIAMLANTPAPTYFATAQPTDTPIPSPTYDLVGLGVYTATPTETVPPPVDSSEPYLYYVQAADTLPAVAVRFGVQPEEILSPDPLSPVDVLPPGQLLLIPRRLGNTTNTQKVLPDSELVYSPSATDFDVLGFTTQAGGKLSAYDEWLKSTGVLSGAEVVQRVAIENSINPRLLLALVEYQSHSVYGQPATDDDALFPLGYKDLAHKGLYHQLVWTVNQLSIGYYNWREGRLTELQFVGDDYHIRLAPELNAGSVALAYYFSQLYDSRRWLEAMDSEKGFPALYRKMFGDPWERATSAEPLYPPGLVQPPLRLPFERERLWAYTGGPHGAWERDGSFAAIDFAPAASEPGCVESNAWVTASASGLVVRSGGGVVVIDLDGDGKEQTGWVLLYLHVSAESSVPVGTWVDVGDRLGHPSCEGGIATGTHVHFARKYNGEWIAAAGAMPLVLSGWVAQAGDKPYAGYLIRGDEKITASVVGARHSYITLAGSDY